MKIYLEKGTVNLIASKVELNLCDNFKELKAAATDAALEKHVPAVTVEGDKVHVVVGSVEHPMTEEHWITSIILETENGFQKKDLNPSDAPKAEFVVTEKPIAVYEYCNLHGLWVKEL